MTTSPAAIRAELRSDHQAFEERLDELEGLELGAAADAGTKARAALALHHAYSAIESGLTRLARFFEGDVPSGPDWHRALLHRMTLEIDGVRPAVLQEDTADELGRLLSFRHFLRHAYAVDLDGDELATMREHARKARPALARDLTSLDRLLSALPRV